MRKPSDPRVHSDPSDELPPDNAVRIALYDAVALAPAADSGPSLSENQLFDRVIRRLRILVPRELHVSGERAYLAEKVRLCIDAGLLRWAASGDKRLITGPIHPLIRYPDGTLRRYSVGLEDAKDRLISDDAKLRKLEFDVLRLVPSLADEPESEPFQNLVNSMREHGYQRQLGLIEGSNGDIVDGRARRAAALIAGVHPEADERLRLPARRDSPLQRVRLTVDLNRNRLQPSQCEHIFATVAESAGRPWPSIDHDLRITRDWRLAEPKTYYPFFSVTKHPFRFGDNPQVQLTDDGERVGLRSLLQAAGMASYNYTKLTAYVHTEEARTPFTGGKKAIFVRVADAINGIEAMQADRTKNGRRHEPAWDEIRDWLSRLPRANATDQNEAQQIQA
jgi:hypothetical protein